MPTPLGFDPTRKVLVETGDTTVAGVVVRLMFEQDVIEDIELTGGRFIYTTGAGNYAVELITDNGNRITLDNLHHAAATPTPTNTITITNIFADNANEGDDNE